MEKQYIFIDSNGDKFYYKDKEMTMRHRTDGPATEYARGDKIWYMNGVRHRTDGPAIEWSDGSKHWWVNGKNFIEEQFNALNDPVELTLEDIAKKFNVDVNLLKIIK